MRVLVVVGALMFVAAEARAADAGASPNEVTTLEAQLGRESSELSTSDCSAACRALASIRRAADRICELEPGPRCNAARAKAESATKRVREACPECGLALLPLPDAPKEERAMTQTSPGQSDKLASAPPAESERGGCRSCATTEGAAGPSADWLVLAGVIALLRRRKKNG